jgi:hypothetical protein
MPQTCFDPLSVNALTAHQKRHLLHSCEELLAADKSAMKMAGVEKPWLPKSASIEKSAGV